MYLGVVPGIMISFLVAFIEFIMTSSSGVVGLIMNFVSTIFYVTPFTLVYKNNNLFKSNFKKFIVGICLSTIFMTISMIILNIILTPIYLGIPLKELIKLLSSIIIPFNLVKGIINGILIIIINKPLQKIFQKLDFN